MAGGNYLGQVEIVNTVTGGTLSVSSAGAASGAGTVSSIPSHNVKLVTSTTGATISGNNLYTNARVVARHTTQLVTSTTGLKIEALSASTIEHEHRKIHDGTMFLWERKVTATTTGAVKRYMVVVPNRADLEYHAGLSLTTNGQTTIRMRKGVTMTNTTLWSGTSYAPLNMNHGSSITSGIRIFGPMRPTLAVTQSGTLIGEAVYGASAVGGRGLPGSNAKYGEFILANNSKYLITIHPEAANLAATLAFQHYTKP